MRRNTCTVRWCVLPWLESVCRVDTLLRYEAGRGNLPHRPPGCTCFSRAFSLGPVRMLSEIFSAKPKCPNYRQRKSIAALTSRKQVTGTGEIRSEGAHYSMRLAARENLNEITRRFTAQKNWVGRRFPLSEISCVCYTNLASSCSSASARTRSG